MFLKVVGYRGGQSFPGDCDRLYLLLKKCAATPAPMLKDSGDVAANSNFWP
jgi:hypothetical protein